MSVIKLIVPEGMEQEIERVVKEDNYRSRQEFVLHVLRERLAKKGKSMEASK